MNTRNTRINRKKAGNNRLIHSIIALIFIFAAATGVYLLTQSAETSPPVNDSKETPFTERNFTEQTSKLEVQEAPTDPPETVTEPTDENTIEEIEEDNTEAIEEPETSPEEEQQEEAAEDAGVEAPEDDLSSMIANAKPYVYTIYTDVEQGSGFLFNAKGDILTNAHVVDEAAYVTVINSNGQEFNGRVIGISDTEDIALIRVPDIAGKQPIEMEMNKAEPGTKVFALGSPENIHNTSTEGEILSTGNSFFNEYQYDELYEMTANIRRGSSGGPLISAETGKILGINSIVLTDTPEIGYAIPVYTVIEQLKNWAANPIPKEEEIVMPDVRDAYFSEELLRAFLLDYYTLIPYSLNDEEVTFYKFFLLPGSQAEQKGQEMVEELKSDSRIFDAVDPVISSVEIGKEEAVIQADATFTFHESETGEVVTISHSFVYTIVIDEYGDYQISLIAAQ